MLTTITESLTLVEAAKPADGPGRLSIKIISEGQGSSGYYPAATLEEAASEKIFPKGTPIYVDHPTVSDRSERPERSIKDLAGVLAIDATYRDGALFAEAKIYPHWAPLISAMAEDIGMSIRAKAEATESDRGLTITRFTEAGSVDFVTKAGRGGQVLAVLESARPVQEARNIGQWLESRLHANMTTIADDSYGDGRLTREERITLSGALGDALAAFTSRIEKDAPQLFTRDLWDEPAQTPAAAIGAAQNSPSDPAGVTENRKEPAMGTIQIEEAEHKALQESASRVTELEEANKKLVADANMAVATQIVTEAFTTINAPKTAARLIESAPLTEAGVVDREALKTLAESTVAEIAVAAGAGKVTGLGYTAAQESTINDSDIVAVLQGGAS